MYLDVLLLPFYVLRHLVCTVPAALLRYHLLHTGWARSKSPSTQAFLRTLYSAQASVEHFSMYTPEAVFEDPVIRACGRAQIRAAFFGMGWLFSRCTPTMVETFTRDGRVRAVLAVEYVPRGVGVPLCVASTVELWTDADGRVRRHEERWLGVPLPCISGGIRAAMGWVTWVFAEAWAAGTGSGKA